MSSWMGDEAPTVEVSGVWGGGDPGETETISEQENFV